MLEIIKDYKKYIIIGLTILVILISGGIIAYKENNKDEEVIDEVATVEQVTTDDNTNIEEVKEESKYYNVDIKGAVKNPGVYQFKEGSLVNDVIKAAGLKSSGTTKNINLSKKISDEMVIYVYTSKELSNKDNTDSSECVSETADISNCDGSSIIVTSGDDSTSSSSSSTNETKSGLVNINTASKETLMTLTGIGEAKAEAIIKYREENNGFKSTEEIMNVSGIGEVLYNKFKDNITI